MVKELAIRKPVFWGVSERGGLAGLFGLRTSLTSSALSGTKNRWVEIFGFGCLYVSVSRGFIGDTCLRINLLTKRALAEAGDGDIVEIITDNLSSVETIPFMSPNYGGVHLATCQDAQCWRIYVQKNIASGEQEGAGDGSFDE